jgi:hypothetical protein
MSKKDFGPTIAIALSQGAFLGLSSKGAVVAVRDKVNKKFYGKDIKPEEILFDDNFQIPEGKVLSIERMENIYALLDKLAEGAVVEHVPGETEEVTDAETSAAMEAAAAAELEHMDDPDVVHVDAREEAKKEDVKE